MNLILHVYIHIDIDMCVSLSLSIYIYMYLHVTLRLLADAGIPPETTPGIGVLSSASLQASGADPPAAPAGRGFLSPPCSATRTPSTSEIAGRGVRL